MTVSFVKHDSSDDSYSDATGTLTIGGGSGDVAGDTHAASSKATPVDADELPLVDSAASFALKKLTWANLKATLKTYFDTLYQAAGTYVAATRTLTAGSGLSGGGDLSSDRTFDVNVDGSTIEINSDSLRVKASGITANEIAADAVGSSELADDAVDLAALGSSVTPGLTQLVFAYTVSGSDKASIDTGTDTADAGSLDWTNGDLLEVELYVRTDDTATFSDLAWLINNDGSGNYDRIRLRATNTTVSAATELGGTSLKASVAGGGSASGVFASCRLSIPAFSVTTVGNKSGQLVCGSPAQTAAHTLWDQIAFEWRNTAAITRLSVASAVAGKKLVVGTRLRIYKRLAA